MSHSSHSSCLSGSCLPPHRWQAHTRQALLWSSLQCLQDGPLFPGHGGQGHPAQGARGPSPTPGRKARTGPQLTPQRVFGHGAPLARALDLEDLVHEDDPAVVERVLPAGHGPSGLAGGSAAPHNLRAREPEAPTGSGTGLAGLGRAPGCSPSQFNSYYIRHSGEEAAPETGSPHNAPRGSSDPWAGKAIRQDPS